MWLWHVNDFENILRYLYRKLLLYISCRLQNSCGNDGSEVGVVTAMVMGDDNGGVMVINGYYGCVINCTNK